MEAIGLVTGLLLVLLEDVRAEFCAGNMAYCESGCCGSTCCADNINIPVIVGSTVGSLAFIVIVIISICVYLKKSNKSARTIGDDPNMMATAALAAQQAGISPQMVPPFGYSAYPSPTNYYGMQPNPLLSSPLSANLPPPYLAPYLAPANHAPYLAPANHAPYLAPPNLTSANPAPANHPPPNPAAANPAPPNPPPANPPPNPPPENPAPPNPSPQQAPSPN
ncbi:vegetative cell wall protein gp1-like [Haliotis rubra]|uniref:vegetative cell wall protein gp1-like n=1 Tax=Haliotis rubra TaxID=36100 RepID=UPI001EE5722D|nr:vegetative cell wall protein gp1-like [Haliotis rubra]